MLIIKNIDKKFKEKVVLNQVNATFDVGMNFIVGTSGSGKTTLLKIISAIDHEYGGDVLFNDKSLKSLNKKQLSNYYSNSVGFIWQNFNLLENLSVAQNIELVLNLDDMSKKDAEDKIIVLLKSLAIEQLMNQKVSTLSGGQKQRVAIARALIKNPDILICDEPTGALDKESSKNIISILKKVAKTKTVIIVTHDKSIINNDCNVFELDKTRLVHSNKIESKNANKTDKINKEPKLTMLKSFDFSYKNYKSQAIKNIFTTIILCLASFFLLLNFSGNIVNEQQEIIDQLVYQRGDKIRDIQVLNHRMNYMGGVDKYGNPAPDREFTQDVSDVLYKFSADERIEYLTIIQFLTNISFNFYDIDNNYNIRPTNNTATYETIVAGKMPSFEGREVVVSEQFVKNLGLTNEEIIGQKIDINGQIFENGPPPRAYVDVFLKDLTIVGVIESSFSKSLPNGQIQVTPRDDSFIFSFNVIKEVNAVYGNEIDNASFNLRVKDIKDVMEIVDEINDAGIIAIGEFESLKDILRISDISTVGTKSLLLILTIIGFISIIVITLINYFMRKYEFAILKINGYSNSSIAKLILSETIITAIITSIMFVLIYNPVNKVAFDQFSIQIASANSLYFGIFIIICVSLFVSLIGYFIAISVNVSNNLLKGDR